MLDEDHYVTNNSGKEGSTSMTAFGAASFDSTQTALKSHALNPKAQPFNESLDVSALSLRSFRIRGLDSPFSLTSYVESVIGFSSTQSSGTRTDWRSSWMSVASTSRSYTSQSSGPAVDPNENLLEPSSTLVKNRSFEKEMTIEKSQAKESNVISRDLSGGSQNSLFKRMAAILKKDEFRKDELRKDELDVWKLMIDETQLRPAERPTYSVSSLTQRSCCDFIRFPCNLCGFDEPHYWARLPNSWAVNIPGLVSMSKCDFFGNTAFHHAAACGIARLEQNGMIAMLSLDNARARNSSGETFLHVLELHKFDGSESTGYERGQNFLKLLDRLDIINFPFNLRDFHGRTICQRLFQKDPLLLFSEEAFHCMLKTLQCDLDAADNFGERLQLEKIPDLLLVGNHAKLLDRYRKQNFRAMGDIQMVSFRQRLESVGWKSEPFLEYVRRSSLLDWIDVHGDTPLLTILKKLPTGINDIDLTKCVINFLAAGVDVNMRDRRGNTALAIAVVRGVRPVAEALLNKGAMPNSRNYAGHGIIILALARTRWAKKRRGKTKLFAAIMSCVMLLIDVGAKSEPSERDEWLSQETVASLRKKGAGQLEASWKHNSGWDLSGATKYSHSSLSPGFTPVDTQSSPTTGDKSGRETPDYFGRGARYKSPSQPFSALRVPVDEETWI